MTLVSRPDKDRHVPRTSATTSASDALVLDAWRGCPVAPNRGRCISRTLPSRAAGAAATPAHSISFTPWGKGDDVRFIAWACFLVSRLATNSPVASMIRWLSFRPPLEKRTIGGASQKAL
jgi:hypothetical protein